MGDAPVEGSGVLLLCTGDPRVARSMAEVAAGHNLTLHPAGSGDPPRAPAVVLVDLDTPGAADTLAELRARFPEALIAGHLGLPDRDRWLAAEAAGCDLVANRGAIASALRRRLAAGPRRGRRHPVMAGADVAGRLGVVHREAGGPAGPVAVYHLGNRLFACTDRCPHAGAVVSEGELAEGVVTCPRHGSQFDVRTGERRRGPADTGLSTLPVIEEGGQVYLLVAPSDPEP